MIDHSPKQEGHYSSSDHHHDHHNEKEAKEAPSSSSNSSQWLRLKDPRIVRVSRAFGGKDRHSKVCTIRGLRDRRVRLSVPTAIQLYDLQDRLGLNQPSKVVDWLLNAAKHEIDELPPLPDINIPLGNNFTLGFPSSMMMINNEANTTSNDQLFNNRGIIQLGEGSSSQNSSMWKSKPREEEMVEEKSNWMMNKSSNEEEDKQGSKNKEGQGGVNVLGGNNNSVLLPIRPNHHSSFLGLLNTMPIGNYQWEASSDVAQLGNHHIGFTNQTDLHHHHHGINVVPFPSTLSLSTGNNNNNPHQILVCPPPPPSLPHHGSTTQSYFPSSSSHVTAAMEFMDPRQINNHYQTLASSSHQNPPSFSLAMMTPRLLQPSNSREYPSHHKDHDFPSN